MTVRVNFRADAVALEPDETFRLTLSGGLPSGPNVFIDGTAEFTIIDGDGMIVHWLYTCLLLYVCVL